MVSYLCDICGDICDICGTGGVIQDPAHLDVLFMTLGTITVHGSLTFDQFYKKHHLSIFSAKVRPCPLYSAKQKILLPHLKSSHHLEAPHCIVIHYIALRYKGSIYLRRSLLYSGIHFATSRYCVLFIAPDLYIYNISSPCMEDTLLTRVLHLTAMY